MPLNSNAIIPFGESKDRTIRPKQGFFWEKKHKFELYGEQKTSIVNHVEAKLHGESKVIQRCFDDNNDDNKR